MKLKPNFELRNVCGENVVVPNGIENIDFNRIIYLNETGGFLWKEAEKGDFTADSLVAALLSEYEVEADVAKADVEAFMEKMVKSKLAE